MKIFLPFFLIVLVALVGCKKQPEMASNLLVIKAIKGDFDTKATETAFEVNDKIGLYVNENVGNLPYETLDGISWKCLGFLNGFLAGKDYYATAYYPYSESATNPSAIEVGSGIDFMLCPSTKLSITNNTASGTLQFKHVLSKLLVNIDTPEEIDGVKTVSLDSIIVKNVFRKGVINLAAGVISGLTDKGDIVVKNGEAIIIPQTVSRIEFIFKMANNKFSKLAYNTPLLLESGKKTTLNAHSNADLYFASLLDLKSGEAQTNLPISIYVATGRKWTLTSSAPWLTFSKTSGTGKGLETITVTVTANTAFPRKPRAASLTLADDKPSKTTTKTMQNYAKVALVEIAGTKWTTANLTGDTQGQTTGFRISDNPQDYGFFWKWGSIFAYNRIGTANVPAGHWGGSAADYNRMSATSPTANNLGYNYGSGLSSTWAGTVVGDPCSILGAYRTPTKIQWAALFASGSSSWTVYQNVYGYFFGAAATSCNNTTIKPGCIFIPAAGNRHALNGGTLDREGQYGWYWTSSVYDVNNTYYTCFGHGLLDHNMFFWRGFALSVRCVAE